MFISGQLLHSRPNLEIQNPFPTHDYLFFGSWIQVEQKARVEIAVDLADVAYVDNVLSVDPEKYFRVQLFHQGVQGMVDG